MKKKKLYLHFWLTGLVILLYQASNPKGYISPIQQPSVDLHIHTIDFGAQHALVVRLTLLFFFIIGFGYWLTNKFKIPLTKRLTVMHVWITLGITWFCWIIVLYSLLFPVKFDRLLHSVAFDTFSMVCSGLLIIAQLFYVLNIILGLVNKNQPGAEPIKSI
jgi:hypothetical protein